MRAIYTSELKLVLLGESSVGKSSIVTRFTTGNFHRSNATIGAAFTTKTLSLESIVPETGETIDKKIKFEIWDTAGQERYRSLAPMYYRNTDVALIVFDVTNKDSIARAQSWIDELNSYINEGEHEQRGILIKIVGNKIDLNPEARETQNLPYIQDQGYDWFPVSAKTGDGIDELFDTIVKEVPWEKFTRQNPHKTNEIAPKKSIVDLGSQKVMNSCSC